MIDDHAHNRIISFYLLIDPYFYPESSLSDEFIDIKFDIKNFPKFREKIVHIVLDKEPENLIKKNILSNSDLRLNSINRIREPVSYTHLRAHETKANLVCRLLLEKKNKTTLYHPTNH